MPESGRDSARLRCDEHPLGYIEDIMINILIRLPAKTVAACKTVAKHFPGLIYEPDFPLMHLAMSKRNMKYIICSYPVTRDNFHSLFVMEDGKISEDVSLPYFRTGSIAEMNCFPNGLVCSVHEDHTRKPDIDIRIFNPRTKDMIVLPRGSTSTVMPTVGVVFDPISNDYKAYRFFVDPAKTVGVDYMCEVYTASSKKWRTIAEEVKHPCHSFYHPHCPFYASVAGVMYWFEWLDGGNPGLPVSILSVDMNYNFTNIALPADLTNWSFLIEFEGCLAVVHIESIELSNRNRGRNSQPVVEVFKLENGEWNSRLRIMMADLSDIYCVNSVAAKDNEIFFIVQLEDESFDYIVFDFVEETFKNVEDLYRDLEGYFPVAFPFAESLLTPSEM